MRYSKRILARPCDIRRDLLGCATAKRSAIGSLGFGSVDGFVRSIQGQAIAFNIDSDLPSRLRILG